MRAAFIDGKDQIEVREAPIPVPGEGEVRLRVDYVGICGSDMHYFFEGANGEYVVREPLAPGHELSGRVDEDPSGTFAPGTPVTVHPARFGTSEEGIEDAPHLWPNGSYLGSASTWPHTQGAMSEYFIVRSDMVRVLPDTVPVRRAALAEPLSVALHAAGRAGDLTGKKVLVTGAGPIGLLAVAAARARGAAEIAVSDLLEAPLERAKAVGADTALRIGVDEIPAGAFDVVLECSGSPSGISSAVAAVRRRGTVVQVGMVPAEPRPVNLAPLISKEAQLVGTFRFNDEIGEAIELLGARPEIEDVITHVLPLDEVEDAFQLARDSRVSSKVVVALPGAED